LGIELQGQISSAKFSSDIISIERTLVYRSDFMHVLYSYIELSYLSGPMSYYSMRKEDFLRKVQSDMDILELFCKIVSKRLFILDDKEFIGEKSALVSNFLPVEQTEKVSLLLNFISYRIFESQAVLDKFKQSLGDSDSFILDLSQLLARLVNRMNRLRMWPDDFWVVDKSLF